MYTKELSHCVVVFNLEAVCEQYSFREDFEER